jgi:prevent-host-death family protein
MKAFNIHEAKARLSELIEKAMLGEEVIIAKGNKPVAKLTALTPARTPRVPGSARGKIWIAPDFDAPLDEFKDYMP